MDDEPEFMPLEVHAVIPDSEPVQRSAVSFEFPKRIEFSLENLLRQPTEVSRICSWSSFGIRASSAALVGLKMI